MSHNMMFVHGQSHTNECFFTAAPRDSKVQYEPILCATPPLIHRSFERQPEVLELTSGPALVLVAPGASATFVGCPPSFALPFPPGSYLSLLLILHSFGTSEVF